MNADNNESFETNQRMPRISVSLEMPAYEELNRIASKKRVSMAWVIRDAVSEYLKQESPLFFNAK